MHYINASATAFVNFLIKNSQEKRCNYLIPSHYFVKENTCFYKQKKKTFIGTTSDWDGVYHLGKRVVILSPSGKIVYATPDNARPVNRIIIIIIIISNNYDNK